MALIYKICPASLWREATRTGLFTGAPVDLADGFIHFSTATQAVETAAKHFAGQGDLLLVAVADTALGPALRYEPSRGGALFPHLYGPLHLGAVQSVVALPLGLDGTHVFPAFPNELAPEPPFDPARAGWTEHTTRQGLISTIGPFWAMPGSEGRLHGFQAEARHLNINGVVHGGMLMTFADHALALASAAVTSGQTQATIQLDTQFLDAVQEGDFVVATCRVLRQARSLMFMSADLHVGSRAVASSSGVWKLRGSA
jgi:uncharacterized protein (TIGR00369 family)